MMQLAHPLRGRLRICAAVALLIVLGAFPASRGGVSLLSPTAVFDPAELRGAWVQERAIRSRESVDAMLGRAEAGGLNAIFVCVFADGRTLYASALARMSERVAPGFNPLAYLVPEAHRRGIAVHAWFVAGLVGDKDESPILAEHPEWALVGPDGRTTDWLNFTRPDVRRFVGDLMLEVVQRYQVDGVHFDYTRYPGGVWGFDPYSVELFTREHQYDLNQLRYADLPAYSTFDGNPLVEPETADVLASFANGLPAVTLNRYGEGEVILLNWSAGERDVSAGGVILGRSLERLLDEGGSVYLLRSATNAEEYGYDDFVRAMAWLDQLGWRPREVGEEGIASLGPASVLVLPNIYRIAPATAAQLAEFVRLGGGVIFIDGPTRSIKLDAIRAITGMRSRGRHFNERMLLVATGEHPLIPASARAAELADYQAWDKRWRAFRARGISALIGEVYRRVKASDADVIVSVTVSSDQQQAADDALQDWAAWLEGGYIDLLIPRAYVDDVQRLAPTIAPWQPLLRGRPRITVGLKVFTADGKAAVVKPVGQMLIEIQLAHDSGSSGIMLFDLDRVSDEQLRALAGGPFSAPATQN